MAVHAFLSYTHSDEALVIAVADALGRPYASVDRISFRAGEDLLAAMNRAVDSASVFVLFASRESLKSPWVHFEQSQASFYAAAGRIKRTLLVVLDDRITTKDLPDWLTKFKFVRIRAAKPIARIIRTAIDELTHEQQSPFYVGRAAEFSAIQAALVPPFTDSAISSPVVIKGLPGVGRRTVLERAARASLQIDRLLVIRVEPGDHTTDICVKMAAAVRPSNTPSQALELATEVASLEASKAAKLFIDCVQEALAFNELTVLYDEGGLLSNEGEITLELRELVTVIQGASDLPVALVAARRPKWRFSRYDEPPVVSIQPLPEKDIRQLIALAAKREGLILADADLIGLARIVGGYPPAVPILIDRIRSYGSEVTRVGGIPQSLFSPRQLGRYLQNLELQSESKKIASVLALNSPLPLPVLASVCDDPPRLADFMVELIDASIVEPDPATSWYWISEPVRSFVVDHFPPLSTEVFATLADSLDGFLANAGEGRNYLDLSRVLFRAFIRAGKSTTERAYALVADWIRIAERSYHERRYQNAVDFARQAYQTSPSAVALQWEIRALVKLRDYETAERQIGVLSDIGEVREATFYRGFLEQNRGNYRKAISAYTKAYNAGRGGMAIRRDMAECHYHLGDLHTASGLIGEALEIAPENRYLLDLGVRIFVSRGDEASSRELLNRLELCDSAMYYNHRRSRLELAFSSSAIALEYAMKAASSSDRPRQEILANLGICQILNDDLTGADQSIASLSKIEGRDPDVVTGLKARLAIARQEYEEALGLCARFERQAKPVHRRLKRDAIAGLLAVKFVSDDRRYRYQQQLDEIGEFYADLPSDSEILEE